MSCSLWYCEYRITSCTCGGTVEIPVISLVVPSGSTTKSFDCVEVPALDFLGWELVVSVMDVGEYG